MAFTESWIETDPDGAVVTVSQADDHIRLKGRAVRERLEGDPAVLGSGVYESGTFAATAMVKKGVGRAFTITNADQSTTYLQDGRLAINLDTNALYHSRASGLVTVKIAAGDVTGIAKAHLPSAIAYEDESNVFVDTQRITGRLALGVNNVAALFSVTHSGIVNQNVEYGIYVGYPVASGLTSAAAVTGLCILPNNGVTRTSIIGFHAQTHTKGATDVVTNAYGLKVEDQTIGGTNYAIYTGVGHSRFGGQIRTVDGANGGPYAIAPESNTSIGFWFTAAGQIGLRGQVLVDGGALLANPFSMNADGAAATPVLRWEADVDMGMYRIGADNIGFTTAATLRASIDADGCLWVRRGGTATVPTISVGASRDCGFFLATANVLEVTVGSGTKAQFTLITGVANDGCMVLNFDTLGMRRIKAGAADSGGVGFRLLRVDN